MNKSFTHSLAAALYPFVYPPAAALQELLFRLTRDLNIIRRRARFRPRPNDLYVCTYPKSGTTWAQMILFQLTSDGDLDKAVHLSKAIPHIEEAAFDLEALPEPRIFKTHLLPEDLPPGARVVYVARDGLDVAHSYFHHYVSRQRYGGSFEDFLQRFLAGDVAYGSWFEHMAKWSALRPDPRVLWLDYEDMLANLEQAVRKVAAFAGIALDEAQLPRILERCSFDYMKRCTKRVDVGTVQLLMRLDAADDFVREGKVGAGERVLAPERIDAYRQVFARRLGVAGQDR